MPLAKWLLALRRSRPAQLTLDPAVLDAFCARWGVADLEIMGNPCPPQEVPIVVTFDPKTTAVARAWRAMRDDLAALVGRPVSLHVR